MPVRVLQVAAKCFTLANFALPLMERLRTDGFVVEALGRHDGFEGRLTQAGFTTHPWSSADHTFNPLAILRARRELARFLARRPYDIIHTHCSFGGIIGNPVAFPVAGRLLYTQHGFYVHEGLGALRRLLWLRVEKVGLQHAHRVICVSQAEHDLVASLGVAAHAKLLRIPGAGVDVDRFRMPEAERTERRRKVRFALGLEPEEFVPLTAARLTWDKGYRELIGAVRSLVEAGHRFRVLAAGSGKDEQAIAQTVRQAGLQEVLLLLGWRDDMVDLYSAADAFVFTSHREGLPIAPIEALASGLPVLASDLPGCREEIQHEQSGLLYPVGDVAALAAGMRRLIEDRSLSRRFGEAARSRADTFALSRVLDLQLALYQEVAAEL